VPNYDPQNPNGCTAGCKTIVSTADGSITNPGVTLGGGGTNGIVGENFWLVADCSAGATCTQLDGSMPIPNSSSGPGHTKFSRGHVNLEYLPGAVPSATPPAVAVPLCTQGSGSAYQQLIEGCDQTTIYQCGVPYNSSNNTNPNMIDLSENPVSSGDTTAGVQCLIHQSDNNFRDPQGQDYLSPYEQPSSFPFQIYAGSSNPITSLQGNAVTASNSVVSLPIFDTTAPSSIPNNGSTTAVTIVGFLQVFINAVDDLGNINVTVLNVSGCGNGSTGTLNSPVTGSSPVPVRLITPP
jgi:hypothetical protein